MISGSGALFDQGAGTFTITGSNTYSGGTTLAAGILNIQNNNALGTGPLTFAGSSTFQAGIDGLTFSNPSIINGGVNATIDTQTFTFTLSNSISGGGSLTKIGSGTAVVTGTDTYSGLTSINAGTFVLNGSLTSPVVVGAGATLKGTGTLFNSLDVFGTVHPGNPVGTLTVTGPTTFEPGSTFIAELNPGPGKPAERHRQQCDD